MPLTFATCPHVQVARVIWKQGHPQQRQQQQVLAALTQPLARAVPDMASPKQPANGACAKAGVWDAGLWPALLRRNLQLLPQSSGHDAANVWWALSEAQQKDQHQLLQALQEEVQQFQAASAADIKQRLPSMRFAPQGLSNVLLACARLGYSSDAALLDMLVQACAASAATPTDSVGAPQGAANAVYAVGLLSGTHGYQPDPAPL